MGWAAGGGRQMAGGPSMMEEINSAGSLRQQHGRGWRAWQGHNVSETRSESDFKNMMSCMAMCCYYCAHG